MPVVVPRILCSVPHATTLLPGAGHPPTGRLSCRHSGHRRLGCGPHLHSPIHGPPPCCGVWRGSDDNGATGNLRRFGAPRGPRSGWDQSQWGIYLADLYAQTPSSLPLPGLALQIAGPIPYQCIAEGAIDQEDWYWSTAGHALRRAVSTLSFTSYLSNWDVSRALRGAPPKLKGTTTRFAVRNWDLGKRDIAQRGRENRAIADPTPQRTKPSTAAGSAATPHMVSLSN